MVTKVLNKGSKLLSYHSIDKLNEPLDAIEIKYAADPAVSFRFWHVHDLFPEITANTKFDKPVAMTAESQLPFR